MKARIAIAAGLSLLVMPAVASACPYCAGRAGGGIGQGIAIGLFILFPFVVATIVYRIAKSGEGMALFGRRSEALVPQMEPIPSRLPELRADWALKADASPRAD